MALPPVSLQEGAIAASVCAVEHALCWSCDYSALPIVLGEDSQEQARTVDLRQSKRYRLKASVRFSWENAQGSTIRGEGYTRDISPIGVFVLTSDRLPSGAAVTLEVSLPPLREEHSGACLRTQGQVIRSEEVGFAAVANMGFQMQFSESKRSRYSLGKLGGDNGANGAKQEASGEGDAHSKRLGLVTRYWM